MADEIAETVQIIRVAYDGIEIAMKVGSDGIEAMKKVLSVLKGMLDYEKNLGRTSMRKLLMRGGDLQVLQFSNDEMGKVKRLAKKYGKTVIAFTGATGVDAEKCNEHGIDAFFPILRNVVTLEEAMKNENAKQNLADTTEQVIRLMK